MTTPPKPTFLHDRDEEWARLVKCWDSDRPELVFVLGQRRVGKSSLLAPLAAAVGGFYYQATRRSEAEQLLHVSRLLGAHFEDPALRTMGSMPDWASVLRYVAEKTEGRPFVLVLYEYPYLEEVSPGISTVLQSFVDHDLPGTRIKLVLSGSYVSAMKRLEAADQPLFSRRTARLTVTPFPYFRAAELYPHLEPRDRLAAYGVFGGLPGHVTLVERSLNLGENVAAHVLDSGSRLFDEGQRILDTYRTSTDVHYSILSAIAHGEHTWKGITGRTGKTSGSISRPLQWLLDMEVVRREVPVTESSAAGVRRAVYRLADPYLRFWYRVVSPLIQAGAPATLSPEDLWTRHVLPRLDDHMGGVFEDVALSFVEHARHLPFQPLRVGRWWDAASVNEIDVVALSDEGDVLAAECKWGRADAGVLDRLRRRAALLIRELGSIRRLHLALFTAREVEDEALRRAIDAGHVLLYTARDLYEGVEHT